eukprot:m.4463 g.4463  ORF g.4463 m.4463 type:complete len:346 (+) comp4321_c0_seq2:1850-2887(+)
MAAVQHPYVDPWADREIQFDMPRKQLELVPGEVLIDSLGDVEDTKGNNGDHGHLYVTNLRLMWDSVKRPQINLSIGYAAIINISVRTAESRLRGSSKALFILCKAKDTRYQFIFTNVVPNTPRLFTTVLTVHRAFETTPLYRNVKLRSTVVQDRQLLILPHEEIYEMVDGVWNLANDAGTLGALFVTNIRVVWFAHNNELYNVSLPYIHMADVSKREIKFGKVLVFKTSQSNRGFVLGFRIDPEERLNEVVRKVSRLREIALACPIFGVDFEVTPDVVQPAPAAAPEADDVQILPTTTTDACAAYFAEDRPADLAARGPEFSSALGLAIEPLRAGVTLESLWAVH